MPSTTATPLIESQSSRSPTPSGKRLRSRDRDGIERDRHALRDGVPPGYRLRRRPVDDVARGSPVMASAARFQ